MHVHCLNEEQLSGRCIVLVWDGSKCVGKELLFGVKLDWCRVLNFANIAVDPNKIGEERGVGGGGHIGKGKVAVVIREAGGSGDVVVGLVIDGKGLW